MTEGAFRQDIVRRLRSEREAAGLTSADLAARSGVSAATLTRIERGTMTPSIDNLEKIFAALGLRLRLSTEPMEDVDAELERLSWIPLSARLEKAGVAQLLRTLTTFPFVIDGGLAAALQGVPMPVDALELIVSWRDADAFTGWLVRRLAYRWNDTRQEFRLLDLDPRAPGPHYWQTATGKVRARMVQELPEAVDVAVGGGTYPVRPLAGVQSDDESTVRMLRRHRERIAA